MSRTWEYVGTDGGHRIVTTGICPHDACQHTPYLREDVANKLYDSGQYFYCPDGHGQSWEGKKKRDEIAAAKRREEQARKDAEHAAAMREIAERTCPWPTCDGRVLASPRGLRQHMVKAHGAPWASPLLEVEEIGQVLNGRDPADVVR